MANDFYVPKATEWDTKLRCEIALEAAAMLSKNSRVDTSNVGNFELVIGAASRSHVDIFLGEKLVACFQYDKRSKIYKGTLEGSPNQFFDISGALLTNSVVR